MIDWGKPRGVCKLVVLFLYLLFLAKKKIWTQISLSNTKKKYTNNAKLKLSKMLYRSYMYNA